MSRPMADTLKRRPRRQFTDEFKASAVRLVLDEGKTVGAAARDLDLTASDWIRGHTRWLHQIDRLSSLSSNRNGDTRDPHSIILVSICVPVASSQLGDRTPSPVTDQRVSRLTAA